MKMHEANMDKFKRYGPIMKEEFHRGQQSVTIFDPCDIREVFMREGNCPSRPGLPYVIHHRQSDPSRYPNVGLANMMGQEWFELRSQLAPLLLSKELKKRHIGTQNKISTRLVTYIKNLLTANSDNNGSIIDRCSNSSVGNNNNSDSSSTIRHADLTAAHNQNRAMHTHTAQTTTSGGVVDNIQEVFYRFSMESVMNLCINKELGCLDNATSGDSIVMSNGEMIFQAAMKFFEAQHKLYYGGHNLWKYINTRPYRQLRDSQNTIHDIASSYIDIALSDLKKRKHHIANPLSSSESHASTAMAQAAAAAGCTHFQQHYRKLESRRKNSDDAFAIDDEEEYESTNPHVKEHESLIETLYSTNRFSDLEIKSTIVDFIGGGIYTVANALTMTLFLLASNPNVQERLYQEICRVFKDEAGNDIEIDTDKLDQLKFLKLCLKESHRLLPTMPGIARTLQKDLILSNYLVPKDTLVFCNFMVTCRLPQYFENPDSYNPSRWERTNKMKSELAFTVLPFGHGVRKCIGHNFAELELYVALAKIIKSFKVRTVNNQDVKTLPLSYKFIVVPEKPVALEFVARDDAGSRVSYDVDDDDDDD